MIKPIILVLTLAACSGAFAQAAKLPVQTDDQGSVYVSPNVSSTEKSAETKGATIGIERRDGGGVYGGVDTSGARPSYSAGGSTGGDTSFIGGVSSDGKSNTGVKAGVKIRF